MASETRGRLHTRGMVRRGCPRLRLGGDVTGWGIDPAPSGVGDFMTCLLWPGKAENLPGVFVGGVVWREGSGGALIAMGQLRMGECDLCRVLDGIG